MTIVEGTDVWTAHIYMGAVHFKHGVVVDIQEKIGLCSVRWMRDGKRFDTAPVRLRLAMTEFTSSREEALDKLVQKCQSAYQVSKAALENTETRLRIAMAAWTTRGRTGTEA